MSEIKIGDYLLERLAQLDTETIQGVPGDFNMGFLDLIEDHHKLRWVGNANELNAVYSADGYARIKGMIGAVVTTFGVGELSALNGIADTLYEYCKKEPEKPKVLLFSTKPTSSPLYKSLALDFRTSVSFAFLRGDQASVRAATHAHLGVDMKESNLPVLVVIPSREEGTEIEKGNFKMYHGKLKYHDLQDWIIKEVPEAKETKSKKANSTQKKSAAKKPKAAKPKKAAANDDDDKEKLPSGAQVEWRAENNEDSPERKAKLQKIASMLNKTTE